jgi:Cysteine-rich secretory protein family
MGPRMLKIAVALFVVAMPIAALVSPAQAQAKAQTLGPSDFVTMVNNLRSSVGVAPMATDPTLTSVAQQWANNMASTDVLSHNPNLSTQAPSGWTQIGENIADGFSLTAIYNALEASQPHYVNMVNPAFNRTGVGVATDSSGQVWVAEDFGDYPPPPTPVMVFPTTGTTIFPSAQSFSWQQVPGASYYCVTVGSTQGGLDLLNSGLLPAGQLSVSVPALPGGLLWARVYSFVQGVWTWSDASFTVTGPSTAMFTSPKSGATNVSSSQPFTWAPVASSSYYAMTVGTTQGGTNVANSGLLGGSQTSYTVSTLPTGETLWARVYSYIDGSWSHYNDVSFTASGS